MKRRFRPWECTPHWAIGVLRAAIIAVLMAPCLAAAADSPAAPSPEAAQPKSESIWTRDTLTGDWGGMRGGIEAAGVKLGLQEQSEVWGNAAGGLRRGVVYDGLTTASIEVDLAKAVGWTGAKFFVNAFQIHGRGPSDNLVGNLQVVSNIEASRDTKLYQLWIEQVLFGGHLTIRFGQEGANDQMMITQYGALFLNSSFGFPGLPAADLPSGGPNYPMATPFVRVQFQATDALTLVGAIFNGDPAPNGTGDPQLRDKGGTAFRLNDHVLAIGEIWYSTKLGDAAAGLPGTYKLGVWYDSGHFSDQLIDTTGLSLANPASTGVARTHSTGFAVYGIVDQMVWKKPGTDTQGIGLFLQVMGAPAEFNMSNVFVEAGMNWMGPFANRDNDIFGLGVSYLGISPRKSRFGESLILFTGSGSPYAGNETVIEATYLYQVTPWLSLQPDLQLIINPGAGIPSSASALPLKNSIVTGLRTTITF